MKQKLVHLIVNGVNEKPIHVDLATGILYYLKRHRGRIIKFSTGCKADELRKAKRLINEELAKRLGTRKTVRTQALIKDEIPNWIALKETEGLAEDSLKNIRNGAKQFEGFWAGRFPIEMLNPDTRAEFYAWFQAEFPGLQMENAIKQLRSFSGYLCEKVVNGAPVLPTRPKFADPNRKNVRRERKRKKSQIFTADDFARIHASASNEDEALVVHLMYTMATRVSETLSMAFGSEIDLDAEVPFYRWSDGQNKMDLDGFHALHSSLIDPLKSLRSRRVAEGTKLLFPQKLNNKAPLKEQQIDWEAWRERAKIGWHWTPHTFRHTCLSNLFNDERNPQILICKLYRVSLAVAMETYVKPTKSGIEKMRDALEVRL